jgi:hypothetical protein
VTTIQAFERDELAHLISAHRMDPDFNCTCGAVFFPEERFEELDRDTDAFIAAFEAHHADSALAAGYRKPRPVNTIEALVALPFETVIRDAEGHVLERWGDAEHVQWSTPGCKWFVPADQIALPVTVLYEVQP